MPVLGACYVFSVLMLKYQLNYLIVASNYEWQFTFEKPVHACLHFLYLSLQEREGCVGNIKPTGKPLLAAFSCHPGTVKRALINGLISSLQKRSCYHLVGIARQRQVARLMSAGYSDRFILPVLENAFSKERKQVFREQEKERETSIDVPFAHT